MSSSLLPYRDRALQCRFNCGTVQVRVPVPLSKANGPLSFFGLTCLGSELACLVRLSGIGGTEAVILASINMTSSITDTVQHPVP
jgi:hypothetical protein